AAAHTAASGATAWKDTSAPRLGGTALPLGHAEFSRSLAILPGGAGALLGTDTHLRLYGRDGHERAAVETPAAAWAVTVNAAGTVAVAALLDGTIRWYGLSATAIEPRAALFVHADGQRWVLFTPEGFFDESDRGGDDLVGVLLNRGNDQAPIWASFAQAYRPLYGPAVVRSRLAGDSAPARARLAALGDIRAGFTERPGVLVSDACSLRLSLKLTDNGLGVGNVDAFVNGRNAGRTAAPAPKDGAAVVTITVPLDPGR